MTISINVSQNTLDHFTSPTEADIIEIVQLLDDLCNLVHVVAVFGFVEAHLNYAYSNFSTIKTFNLIDNNPASCLFWSLLDVNLAVHEL